MQTNELFFQAVTVNHNTSPFAELMLRSLHARHVAELPLAITVLDNHSQDDMSGLLAYAAQQAIPVRQSGFTTTTGANSHGEVLQRFVLEHPDCSHYLFLDADICFLEENTVHGLLAELDAAADAFGIGVRQSWDGQREIPAAQRQAVYFARLHPCCALVKNSALFRRVVAAIGCSGVKICRAAGEVYLDTLELLTRVMQTHGQRHLVSSHMVYHFFSVSYDNQWMESKQARCAALLQQLRCQQD